MPSRLADLRLSRWPKCLPACEFGVSGPFWALANRNQAGLHLKGTSQLVRHPYSLLVQRFLHSSTQVLLAILDWFEEIHRQLTALFIPRSVCADLKFAIRDVAARLTMLIVYPGILVGMYLMSWLSGSFRMITRLLGYSQTCRFAGFNSTYRMVRGPSLKCLHLCLLTCLEVDHDENVCWFQIKSDWP